MRDKKVEQAVMERRNQTMEDLKSKLEKYGICALVRPTGFGKTTMMAEMTQDYEKVLYLYPADIVMETAATVIRQLKKKVRTLSEDFDIANVRFMTYMKLIRLSDEELAELADSYDLIIMDECHKIGAVKTGRAVKVLMDHAKKHVIGATGTPERTDAVDVIREFFKGICVSEYTLKDAFDDGVIKRPIYTFMSYDFESDLKEEAFTAGQDGDEIIEEVFTRGFFRSSKVFGIPDMIRNVVKKFRNEDYMKFIVFFPTHAQIHDRKEEVEGWFREAFPEYEVESLIVSSETKEYSENVRKLKGLTRKKNRIDLILAVDMLNLGYHVGNLTGIVMYRCTGSPIVYSQQLGRAMSSGSNKRCLVFDIVDNLHRKTAFELKREAKRERYAEDMDDESVLTAVTEIAGSDSRHAKEAQALLEKLGRTEDPLERSRVMEEMRELVSMAGEWWKHASDADAGDFEAVEVDGVPCEAKYREFLARLVGIPAFIRARRAAASYRARYEKTNGPGSFPKSREEFEAGIDTMNIPAGAYAEWERVTVKQLIDALYEKNADEQNVMVRKILDEMMSGMENLTCSEEIRRQKKLKKEEKATA